MIPKEMERTTEINFVMQSERCFFVFEKHEEGVPVSEVGWDGNAVCGTFVRDGVISGDARNDGNVKQGGLKP